MKFLCGRPGCGKESTATLQIDAPSETVSLVDPRISRDGVPLCARHADATTPPVGWTMNDLRSRNRSLSAVPDEETVPTSTPPRVRPEPMTARTMSRRQSIEERASRAPMPSTPAAPTAGQAAAGGPERPTASDDDHLFRSSRSTRSTDDQTSAPAARDRRAADEGADDAPDSRPSRRREVADEVEEPEERFPWHHQYQNDEPEEMQASSPLLSRAFRSSTG